jgi:hypothetical protein
VLLLFGVLSRPDTRPLAYGYPRPSLQSSIRSELGWGGGLRVTKLIYVACTENVAQAQYIFSFSASRPPRQLVAMRPQASASHRTNPRPRPL